MAMKDISTLHKKDLKEEAKSKQKKRTMKWRFYHSFFTIILLFCIAQLTYSALLNVSKTLSYRLIKIPKSKKLQNEALRRNKVLKDEQSNFTSRKAEAIARNNLKMAGENQILLIMTEEDETQKEPETFWEKILQHAEKN